MSAASLVLEYLALIRMCSGALSVAAFVRARTSASIAWPTTGQHVLAEVAPAEACANDRPMHMGFMRSVMAQQAQHCPQTCPVSCC